MDNRRSHRSHHPGANSNLGCVFSLLLLLAVGGAACEAIPEEPKPKATETTTSTKPSQLKAPPPKPAEPRTAPIRFASDDPIQSEFTLAQATEGLTGEGALTAEIQTSLGKFTCDLYEDKAPITVANFVGLARGLRPFKDKTGEWVKRPGYDGTVFHRVIKGFMIQGGDPAGTGAGNPGFVIPDEIWPGARHDQAGLLCMANRGPNTNGMQFFITDGKAAHLDGGYTIFGKCEPESLVRKIASVETRGDRAVDPPKIEKVTISRGTPKK